MRLVKFIVFSYLFLFSSCIQTAFLPSVLRRTHTFSTIALGACKKNATSAFFQKSKEEEFIEFARIIQKPSQSLEDVKDSLALHSFQLNSAPLSNIKARYEIGSLKCDVDTADMEEAFDRLKKMIDVPDEVNIFYSDKSIAPFFYNILDRAVYVTKSGLCMNSAFVVHYFCHELTHVEQHQRMGIVDFFKYPGFKRENEADTTAAEFIECPLCMQAVVAAKLSNERRRSKEENEDSMRQGYLSGDRLKEYLKQKSFCNLCEVHKSVENPDLYSGLDTQEGCLEIIEKDYAAGSIVDRLPYKRNPHLEGFVHWF